MTSSMKSLMSLIGLGCASLLVGCGNGSDSGGNTNGVGSFGGQTAGVGGGQSNNPAASQPGCSTAPACGTCQACYEACVCQTGNMHGCIGACAGQGTPDPIGGGSGGSTGNPGSGGSGNPNPGSGGSISNPGSGGAMTGGGTTSAGGAATGAGGATTGAGGASGNDWQELTLTSDSFTVNAGDEIYREQNFANPIGHDVDIIESESFMTPGSHHMFAFHGGQFNANGALETSSGVEFAGYIHTAQTPQQLTSYPAGIGRFLAGGDGIRLQVHYINTGTQSLQASVSLRIRYVDPSKVQYHAAEVFLDNIGINVPPGQSTATLSYPMPYDVKLLGAASHMHSRAIKFDSKTGDGREIYTTTQWDEPQATSFSPAMDVPAGQTISWSCTWNNTTGTTLSFGESAAKNEMCIFTGVYYPAPGGAGIAKQCAGQGACF